MPLNGSHLALGGAGTGALTSIYMYLTHWPLAPMNEGTATAFATLTLLLLGGGIGAITGNGNDSEPTAVPAPNTGAFGPSPTAPRGAAPGPATISGTERQLHTQDIDTPAGGGATTSPTATLSLDAVGASLQPKGAPIK